MNKVHTIKSGQALAIDPKAVRAGRDAFFWLWSNPNPVNERVGANKDIAVVHIRGPMEHHADGWGDAYDCIIDRVRDALAGTDCEEEEGPPQAVILRIDSPGGVVSGLNETVKKLRAMAAEADIPMIAYVDEMAASAAYAMACACDEIYLPPSAIAGSIGVISTMVDQTRMDEGMGLRFVTLTSGARKADGHPHVAISDAAIEAEQKRVDKLAMQFYRLVQQARGLSPKVIASYEAGIFVGNEAVNAQLADGVMSWDDIVGELSDVNSQLERRNSANEVADPLVGPPQVKPPGQEASTMLKLKNLITKTKAAIASEKDAAKLEALKAKLGSYEATLKALSPSSGPAAKTVHKIEHNEVHTDDGEGGDDDGDEDGDEEDDAEEEAVGNETDRGDKPEGDEEDDAEEEEEAEEEEAEEEEEEAMYDEEDEEAKKSARIAAKALRTALSGLKGEQGEKLRGALVSVLNKASKFDKLSKSVASIKKENMAAKKANLIEAALNKRRITPGEAKQLRGKTLAFTKAFLEMRPKAVIHTTQEDMHVPSGGRGLRGGLSDEMMAVIQKAHMASDGKIPLDKFIEDYKASLNGAAGKQEF